MFFSECKNFPFKLLHLIEMTIMGIFFLVCFDNILKTIFKTNFLFQMFPQTLRSAVLMQSSPSSRSYERLTSQMLVAVDCKKNLCKKSQTNSYYLFVIAGLWLAEKEKDINDIKHYCSTTVLIYTHIHVCVLLKITTPNTFWGMGNEAWKVSGCRRISNYWACELLLLYN